MCTQRCHPTPSSQRPPTPAERVWLKSCDPFMGLGRAKWDTATAFPALSPPPPTVFRRYAPLGLLFKMYLFLTRCQTLRRVRVKPAGRAPGSRPKESLLPPPPHPSEGAAGAFGVREWGALARSCWGSCASLVCAGRALCVQTLSAWHTVGPQQVRFRNCHPALACTLPPTPERGALPAHTWPWWPRTSPLLVSVALSASRSRPHTSSQLGAQWGHRRPQGPRCCRRPSCLPRAGRPRPTRVKVQITRLLLSVEPGPLVPVPSSVERGEGYFEN